MASSDNLDDANRESYLDLLKLVLTGAIYEENDVILGGTGRGTGSWKRRVADRVGAATSAHGFEIVYKRPFDKDQRRLGRDWPARADTMIGLERLDNIQSCLSNVIRDGIPGDLIETGVWRGGATIFMRAVLKAFGVSDRIVWCADSFEGLPRPDPHRYEADKNDRHYTFAGLQVGLEQVRNNFRRYHLLDEQVKFLPGWFEDTLPVAPIEELALLRLDGDMYSSTIQALEALYPKLQAGGYCIVDDYGNIPSCREAVEDYRHANSIGESIIDIDGYGVFWRKS